MYTFVITLLVLMQLRDFSMVIFATLVPLLVLASSLKIIKFSRCGSQRRNALVSLYYTVS